MSKKVMLSNVTIEELYPDEQEQVEGAEVWRLIRYTDGQAALYELYRASYIITEYEPANVENGPQASLEVSKFELMGSGMGHPDSIEDEVEQCKACGYYNAPTDRGQEPGT